MAYPRLSKQHPINSSYIYHELGPETMWVTSCLACLVFGPGSIILQNVEALQIHDGLKVLVMDSVKNKNSQLQHYLGFILLIVKFLTNLCSNDRFSVRRSLDTWLKFAASHAQFSLSCCPALLFFISPEFFLLYNLLIYLFIDSPKGV